MTPPETSHVAPNSKKKEKPSVKFIPKYMSRSYLSGFHHTVVIRNERKFEIFYTVDMAPGSEASVYEGSIPAGGRQTITFRIYDSAIAREKLPVVNVYFQRNLPLPTFWRLLDFKKDSIDREFGNVQEYLELEPVMNDIIRLDQEYLRALEENDLVTYSSMREALWWTSPDHQRDRGDIGTRRAIATGYKQWTPAEERQYRKHLKAKKAQQAQISTLVMGSEDFRQELKETMPKAYEKFEQFETVLKAKNKQKGKAHGSSA